MSIVLHAKHVDGTRAECVMTRAWGTIGRATTNTLVLPDTDRIISRVHAQVVFRDNQYFIIDCGSNPTHLNGAPLGAENEAPLRSGDRLNIGGYEITVEASAASDQPLPATSALGIVEKALPDDNDPFADLLDEFRPVTQASPPGQPEPSVMGDLLGASDAGNDPFADLLAPLTPPAANAPLPSQDDLGLASSPDRSGLDELFGLGPAQGAKTSSCPDDLFADTALGEPLSQPNTAQSPDPLAALGVQPNAPAAALPDNVPGLQFAFTPPAQSSPAASSNQLAASQPPAELPELPAPSPTASAQPAGASPTRPALGSTTEEALLKAFLVGLGPSKAVPEQLSPELMQRLGSLLRLATQGALQLLHTRQEVKRELRAEMTMIAADDNNPLKFSPTVEVALGYLLGQPIRGFMEAERAMRDAFADMCAHQLGVMAGTRAALDNVFKRFAPEALETRISQSSALDKLFAASRKARLWDQFCLLYKELVSEAEDDFQALFGKAFVKAYEEQMARLNHDDKH